MSYSCPLKIIYIIGLPGSGKTTLGNKIALKEGSSFFLDDPSVSHKGQKPQEFMKDIPDGTKVLIIADPHLVTCKQENLIALNKMVMPYSITEFVYFANDLEACKANIERRNKENHRIISRSYLEFLSKSYAINLPSDTKTIPVYKEKVERNRLLKVLL